MKFEGRVALSLMGLTGGLLPACGQHRDASGVDESLAQVVNGTVDYGHQAVGSINGCTATLVEPNVVVTAAHCVPNATPTYFELGRIGSGLRYPSQRVVAHPKYKTLGGVYDIAVVVLSRNVPGITPLRIAVPHLGCGFKSVGYGRTTPGPASRPDGYGNDPRSTPVCIDSIYDSGMIFGTTGGGNCFGDSGGPLLSDDGREIYGVLSILLGENCRENQGGSGWVSPAQHIGFLRNVVDGIPYSDPNEGRSLITGLNYENDWIFVTWRPIVGASEYTVSLIAADAYGSAVYTHSLVTQGADFSPDRYVPVHKDAFCEGMVAAGLAGRSFGIHARVAPVGDPQQGGFAMLDHVVTCPAKVPPVDPAASPAGY